MDSDLPSMKRDYTQIMPESMGRICVLSVHWFYRKQLHLPLVITLKALSLS